MKLYKLVAVAGAVAEKTRGTSADDLETTRGVATGERTITTGQAWYTATPYKCKYNDIFYEVREEPATRVPVLRNEFFIPFLLCINSRSYPFFRA